MTKSNTVKTAGIEDKKRTALALCKGGMSQTEAAKKAGIDRTTLWRHIKEVNKAGEGLELVRGENKTRAYEALLKKSMEMVHMVQESITPEDLADENVSLHQKKEILKAFTWSTGVLHDKLTSTMPNTGLQDTKVIVEIPGLPDLPDNVRSIMVGAGPLPTESKSSAEDEPPAATVEVE